jgi:uroporphyrin-3 C-methyltransferase
MTEDQNLAVPAEVVIAKSSLLSQAALALVIIAFFCIAWQWLNTRQRFNEVEKSLSQKLDQYQTLNLQNMSLAKQAVERSSQANMRTIVLEQRLAESRDQQDVLQTLYDQLTENREATAVAEVEQLITIAHQQLQLAGNIKSALLALQAADKRMQSIALPRAIQLRETLATEIENLRTFPQIDVTGISIQLERLADICATLPLISERQPTLNASAAAKTRAASTSLAALQDLTSSIWTDIKGLVTIERIDRPEPPLLAADHAFYLRENLKLRLFAARIALLQRDELTYKADLKTVTAWLNQYYDTKHPRTIRAFKLLQKLADNNIGIELPQLNESMAAVSRYKQTLESND